jgi:hypothetical protein
MIQRPPLPPGPPPLQQPPWTEYYNTRVSFAILQQPAQQFQPPLPIEVNPPPPPPPRIVVEQAQGPRIETYNTSSLFILTGPLFYKQQEGLKFEMDKIVKKSVERTQTAESVEKCRCPDCHEGFSHNQLESHRSTSSGQKYCRHILQIRDQVIKALGQYFEQDDLVIRKVLYYNGRQEAQKRQLNLLTTTTTRGLPIERRGRPKHITYDTEVVCYICGNGDSEDPNLIILCDGDNCDYAVHQQCITPSLQTIPDGDWYCHECLPSNNTVISDTTIPMDTESSSKSSSGNTKRQTKSTSDKGGNDNITASNKEIKNNSNTYTTNNSQRKRKDETYTSNNKNKRTDNNTKTTPGNVQKAVENNIQKTVENIVQKTVAVATTTSLLKKRSSSGKEGENGKKEFDEPNNGRMVLRSSTTRSQEKRRK